jgi:hypothetical protein
MVSSPGPIKLSELLHNRLLSPPIHNRGSPVRGRSSPRGGPPQAPAANETAPFTEAHKRGLSDADATKLGGHVGTLGDGIPQPNPLRP